MTKERRGQPQAQDGAPSVPTEEAQRAQQLVQDARAYAEAIVDTVREPMLVLSADLRVKTANRSFYKAFRVSPEETENRFIYELGNGQWDIPELREVLEEILPRSTHLEGFGVEHEFPKVGRRTMLLNARRLVQEDARAHLILIAIEDITERKEAERFRTQYLSLIAHDLRSPLAVMMGMAYWLQRRLTEQGSEKEAITAGQIVTSGKRMVSMIRDLVASSRLESGELAMHQEPTDLLPLIEDICKRVGTAEDLARIQVKSPEWVAPVSVDPEQIERAIVNLMINALKYSPPGSPVVVHLGQSDAGAIISVIDQGVGIPPEDIPHLFERNYRASTAGKREGLGLGLYITRLIAEAHGGQIGVESKVGKGSTFHISLPLA